MEPAALGVTSRLCFDIFSQNQTLELQNKLKKIETDTQKLFLSGEYGSVSNKKWFEFNVWTVKNDFDRLHDPSTREAPVSPQDTYRFRDLRTWVFKSGIWADPNFSEQSLSGLLLMRMIDLLGLDNKEWCKRQIHIFWGQVNVSLVSVYNCLADMNLSFSQNHQEMVLWVALEIFLEEMGEFEDAVFDLRPPVCGFCQGSGKNEDVQCNFCSGSGDRLSAS